MRPLVVISAVAVVLVSIAIFGVRSGTRNLQRSRPTGQHFFSTTTPGRGIRGTVVERLAIDSQGFPYSKCIFKMYAGDNSPGAYKDYPSAPPEHMHIYQDETFETLSGRCGYVLDGVEGVLEVGQGSVTAPLGEHPHTFWNADPTQDLDVIFTYTTRIGNSTHFISFLETLFGLSRDYGSPDNVSPLQLLLLFWEGGHLELPMPKPLRLVVRYVVCPLAKLVGFRPTYPEYQSAVL